MPTMARPHNTTKLAHHPAVGTEYRMMSLYEGRYRTLCACVTCPTCKKKRWYSLWHLRQFIKKPTFFGYCRPCGLIHVRAGHTRWAKREGLGKHITSSGYVNLRVCYIKDEDLPLFRAMTPPSSPVVAEHRFVMAKHLRRPLRSNESVDHRDGNKQNNVISNLRLYVRGKNQEGSCNGYGTYYHEWQMALKEIQELKHKYQRLSSLV